MNVLVLNAGSSSLKYQLINVETHEVLAKGICERVGSAEAFHKHGIDENEVVIDTPMPDHNAAMALVLEALTSGPTKAIDSLDDIDAVGHRVVQGGNRYGWKENEIIGDKEGLVLAVALYAIPEFSGSIAIQEAAINLTIIEYELNGQASQFVIDLDAYDPTTAIGCTGSPAIADAVNAQQFYNIPGSASEFEEAICTYIEDHGGTVTSVETISES